MALGRAEMNDHEDDDLAEDGLLSAEKDPVLAELWDNEDDAVYDDPEWQEGEREADEDIRAGRVKQFTSVEDVLRDLEE
jgi:hypothetical protein